MSNLRVDPVPQSWSKFLKLLAVTWLFGLELTAALSFAPLDYLGLTMDISKVFSMFGVIIFLILFFFSFFVKKDLKKKPSNFFIIIFVSLLPLALPFLFLGNMYVFLVKINSWLDLVFRVAMYLIILIYCMIQLGNYRKRIINRRFVENEFIVFEDKIIFRQPSKTSLDVSEISDKSFFGRIYNKYGSYLILLISCAYPLQRIFFDHSGVRGVLIIITILGIPLTAWIFMRLTCAFYLYVYIVLKLERKHGKPVVYS